MQTLRYVIFWLAALLLAGPRAQAQEAAPASGARVVLPRPPATLSDSAAEVAREDTSIAVQRLFFSQRRYGRGQLILGGIEVGLLTYLVLGKEPSTVYQYVATGLVAAAGGFYTYQLASGLVRLRRFRSRHEERVLENYENGQPLPHWVRKRLKSKYFSARVTTY